jgi:hypothetical protein
VVSVAPPEAVAPNNVTRKVADWSSGTLTPVTVLNVPLPDASAARDVVPPGTAPAQILSGR